MDDAVTDDEADWQRRVVGRSLRDAAARSVDRGLGLVQAAATVLERNGGADITVQDVADEAGQSLRTLYQYFESKDDLLLAVLEEAVRTYAELVRRSVEALDDPLERLAGAVIASARMNEVNLVGIERGLARVRLTLGAARPDLVARAQASHVALVEEFVREATEAGELGVDAPAAATFVLVSLNAAVVSAQALGNDIGGAVPDAAALALFCLRGLGARVDETWVRDVEERLWFPPRARQTLAQEDRAS